MIKNVDDFKTKIGYWLNEALSVAGVSLDDEHEIREIQRIISLFNCAVIFELDGNREFLSEISLKEIIDILSDDGKIKKLSEVNFDE